MKRILKKIIILTLAVFTALCFGNVFSCRPSEANASAASASDSNLNMQQLAKDFDFITKFYTDCEVLLSYSSGISSNVLFSTDVKRCGYYNKEYMSVVPTSEYTYYDGYAFFSGSSVAITVEAGIDMIAFGGFSVSDMDLSETVYNAEGNACYCIKSTEEYGIHAFGESYLYWYFAYIGQSEDTRTVIINSEDFYSGLLIEEIYTLKSSSLSITDIATRQTSGEIYYTFVPTLPKTKSNNGIITSILPYSPSASLQFCSAIYPEYGRIRGYYNGIYDSFFGKVRKPDYLGNDRFYPVDITDSGIKKQINTAHKDSYSEFYDYIDNSKTINTEVDYNTNNLPFIGDYQNLPDRVTQFISDYCMDSTGKIYNKVDDDNYEKIISGNETYSSLTVEQRSLVNQKILSANGYNSEFRSYEDLVYYANGLKEVKNFIEVYIECQDGEVATVIDIDEENVGRAVEDYNKYPPLYKQIMTKELTKLNKGLEKSFEEVVDKVVNYKTNNKGNGSGSSDGKLAVDYNLKIDLSNFSFDNFFKNLELFFKDPLKWFQKFGEALEEPINWLWLIIKVVLAVIVVLLTVKGTKAIIGLFED